MEDQCNHMKEIGIYSIALYSENSSNATTASDREYENILKNVREGEYSLVFASPECLLGKKAWRKILCSEKFRDHCIGVAYDEAHIIAQWHKSWRKLIDLEIEGLAKGCSGCQRVQHDPKCSPLHPWEWPSTPWQCIHVDFAGPFLGMMFLVIVDAHSKWSEVITMHSKTTTSKTVEALRTVFARNGLPEQLVSDNGPQFTAEEFQLFLKKNAVKHVTSAPYHPATNGLAERFIQTMKQSLTSMKEDLGSTQTKLSKFLMKYRNTPHSTTGETPATLLMG
ncbi:Transposon Tf2-9 poly [Paramuricea clavata]|uniref:Transposon Tf2-9 poly n=1 Tax=Paramuricea clavata TaxID=317549 RepID=A0A7D9JEG4_PARCT|nr:Transposon Tf2-9 poly [Paramuricea clavata]